MWPPIAQAVTLLAKYIFSIVEDYYHQRERSL